MPKEQNTVNPELAALRVTNERENVTRGLLSSGWSNSDSGLTFQVGGAPKSPENPEGLRTLTLRLADDMSQAEFFFGDILAAHVPLVLGDPNGNEWRITRVAGAMDRGFVRPEPAPLPDDFNPVQVIDYLYARYASRLGTIKMDHMYEIRTESWEGLCAAQWEDLRAEIYIPTFRRHQDGEVAGAYDRAHEMNGLWVDGSTIVYAPGSADGDEALARARRLGVDVPTDLPQASGVVGRAVTKAKTGM